MDNAAAVEKMIGYAEKVLSYCKDLTYEEFSNNSLVVDASVFNLSQIGELTGKIDVYYKQEHPEIPWREMYGLRNRVVHDYEGVNLQLVWEIIKEDLPQLLDDLKGLV